MASTPMGRMTLRPRRNRPCHRRAAKKRDELPTAHVSPQEPRLKSLALCDGAASEKGRTIGPKRCDPMSVSGPKPEVAPLKWEVRSTPRSGHRPTRLVRLVPGTDSRFTHCGPTTCLAKVIAQAQVWAGCSTLSSRSASSPRADSSEISSVAVVGQVLRL
jgi:hypothetical protein